MTDHTLTPARVRFAPSPTGFLHLGGLRTALFDWLYARHTGGQFILRIEDTDQKRYNPDSMDDLKRGLRWLGLEWDEGPDVGGPHAPYVQSERKALYLRYAEQLIEAGYAYRCYATADELEQMRAEQVARGVSPGYDRRHRWLTAAERAAFEAEGRPAVVRFAAPLEGKTVVHDLIRGDIVVENDSVRDPVLLKGDGMPTYHLAVVVDDQIMEITHVLRGEEWISSAPLHKMIFDAFGWTAPHFVHLPVILDPSGKGKMSKRKTVVNGVEFSPFVKDYIESGYLPEAVFNFLTNVGWSYDAEQEIFSRDDAVARFELEQINPSAAALPFSKLEWINGVYIRGLAPADLKARVIPYLSRDFGLTPAQLAADTRLDHLIPLIQERLKVLSEASEKVDWAFKTAAEIVYPQPELLIGRKLDAGRTVAVLEQGAAILTGVEPFATSALEEAFRTAAEAAGLNPGSFFTPFRVAITGKTVSPPLFESMVALGREETVARVRNATDALRAYAAQKA